MAPTGLQWPARYLYRFRFDPAPLWMMATYNGFAPALFWAVASFFYRRFWFLLTGPDYAGPDQSSFAPYVRIAKVESNRSELVDT